MLAALCFGAAFSLPIIVWGLILLLDRDRSWQRHLRRSRSPSPPQRSQAWERRQILLGGLLIFFGAALWLLLAWFNIEAQRVSPPAPW